MAKVSAQVARFGSGKSVRRVEDDALLTGKGRFADDVGVAGQVHLAFLRSPHPHARIAAIDTAPPRALPGVIAVVTGDDLVRAGVKPMVLSADFRRARRLVQRPPRRDTRWPSTLCATSARRSQRSWPRAFAKRATRSRRSTSATKRCRWSSTPSTRSPVARRSCGRKRPTTSRARCAMATPTRPPRRFARPPTRCGSSSSTSASRHVRSSRARRSRPTTPRPNGSTLRVSCQTPTGLRDELCDAVLGIPKDQVRVVVGDVGGGFGMKTNLYPEDVVAAWCASEASVPGQMVRVADGGIPRGFPRPRRDEHGRARARRERPRPRAARRFARQRRRLRDRAGVVIQLLIGPWVVDQHLRHRDHRHPHPGGAHEHGADRRLSWRRAPRSDLHDRAADGRGGARDGDRPGRASSAQHDRALSRCRTATRWTRRTTAGNSSR